MNARFKHARVHGHTFLTYACLVTEAMVKQSRGLALVTVVDAGSVASRQQADEGMPKHCV